MANQLLTCSAVPVNKQLSVGFPNNLAAINPNSIVKIGLGDRLLSFTGWTPLDIVVAWAASTDVILKDITPSVDGGGNLILTHSKAGEDFEVTLLVDDAPLLVSSKVQTLHISGMPSGYLVVAFNGHTSGHITYDSNDIAGTATAIQAGLTALSGIQAGDFVVAGAAAGGGITYTIDASHGQYAGLDIPSITASTTGLTGGTAHVVITKTQAGQAGQDCEQSIGFTYEDSIITANEKEQVSFSGGTIIGGTFDLLVIGNTATIPWNSTATQAKTIVEALGSVGAGNLGVTGGPINHRPLVFTFQGDLAGIDITQMVGDATNLIHQSPTLPITVTKLGEATGLSNGNYTTYWKLPTSITSHVDGSVAISNASKFKLCWLFSLPITPDDDGKLPFIGFEYGDDSDPINNLGFIGHNEAMLSARLSVNATSSDIHSALVDTPAYVNTTEVFVDATGVAGPKALWEIRNISDSDKVFFIQGGGSAKYGPPGPFIHYDDVSVLGSMDNSWTDPTDVSKGITLAYVNRWARRRPVFQTPRLVLEYTNTGNQFEYYDTFHSEIFPASNISLEVQKAHVASTLPTDGFLKIGLAGEYTASQAMGVSIDAGRIQQLINDKFQLTQYDPPSHVLVSWDNGTVNIIASDEPTLFPSFSGIFALPITATTLATSGIPLAPSGPTVLRVRYRTFNYRKLVDNDNVVHYRLNAEQTITTGGVPFFTTYTEMADEINNVIMPWILGNETLTANAQTGFGDWWETSFLQEPAFAVSGGPIHAGSSSSDMIINPRGDGYQVKNVPLFTFVNDTVDPTSIHVDVSTLTTGSTTTLPGIASGVYNIIITPLVGGPFTIPNIPYNVTASQAATRINAVMGAGSVSCSGGPHPGTPITIHFIGAYASMPIPLIQVQTLLAGPFGGATSGTTVRAAKTPLDLNNTYELTVIPGEGTLGVNFGDDASLNAFYLNVTLPEGLFSDGVVGSTRVHSLFIRFAGLNAERLENIINEAFGLDCVRVTRIVHSKEYTKIPLSFYGSVSTDVISAWYYRDIYRLTFCNEYADPDTIAGITLTFPTASTGVAGHPSAFMVLNTYSEAVPATIGPDGAPTFDDLALESQRIVHAFLAADASSIPIQVFNIAYSGIEADPTLTWRYKLLCQYGPNGDVPRTGIADDLSGLRIKFQWCTVIRTNEGTGRETKTYTPIAETVLLDWDTSAEEVRNALERLIYQVGSLNPIFFNIGNVLVTGSLFNSWLPDPNQGSITDPNIESENWDEQYHDLQISLIGKLFNLPFNEYDYELNMVLISPYTWQPTADQVADTRFRIPKVDLDIISKPLPTLRNERQRIIVTPIEGVNTVLLSFGDVSTIVNLTDNKQVIENQLNTLLGQFIVLGDASLRILLGNGSPDPAINNPPERILTASNTAAVKWMPEDWRKSVKCFGTTLANDPMEIEFCGYGLQYSDVAQMQPLFSSMQNTGLVTVTMVQIGVATAHEIFTLTLTGSPLSGTFKVGSGSDLSAALPYTETASAMQAVLVAFTSIGAGKAVCTGGPLNTTPIVCTLDLTLGDTITLVSSAELLNNAVATVVQTVAGGLNGTLTIREIVKGNGPKFWDSPSNWSTGTVPSSGDTIAIEDATSAITNGIRQRGNFIAADNTGLMLYSNRRVVFQVGQKVWIKTTDTLPIGLTTGYYYIVQANDDATFRVSATLGGDPIVTTGKGIGTHSAEIRELNITIYARYTGDQIGLPQRRTNGALEYLATYLEMGMSVLSIGYGLGDGISLGKFNTLDQVCAAEVFTTSQSSDSTIPAVLFLFNNVNSTLYMHDGECGIAVYSTESSVMKSIKADAGDMTVRNVQVIESITGPHDSFTILGSTAAQTLNLTN